MSSIVNKNDTRHEIILMEVGVVSMGGQDAEHHGGVLRTDAGPAGTSYDAYLYF